MTTTLSVWGHSCVRFERAGRVLVIDPGTLADAAGALRDVEAVLVTHEHPDHLDVATVVGAAAAGADVLGPEPVVRILREAGVDEARLRTLAPGERVTLAGLPVEVLGGRHAVIHPALPVIDNLAYLVDGAVLHPGDSWALPAPGTAIDVLLLPLGGPWLRVADAVDHVRAVRPGRVVGIHDAVLSDAGRRLAVGLVAQLGGAGDVLLPAPGEQVPLMAARGDLPVLEDDPSVPPRPEEQVADVARSRPDPEGHGG